MARLLFALVLALFTATASAHAQHKIALSLSPSNPTLGEDVQVSVVIEGDASGEVSWVARPQCEGLSVEWERISQSRQIRSVNMQTSVTLTLSWPGKAVKPGKHVLTPARLLVGGRECVSNQVELSVAQAQSSNFFLLRTTIAPRECFLGQVIRLDVDFLTAEQEIRKVERETGGTYELAQNQYDGIAVPAGLEADFHVTPKSFRQAQGGGPYFGNPLGTEMVNGFPYRAQRLTFLLEPKRAGALEIPAMSTFFHALRAVAERTFFFEVQYRISKVGAPFPAASPAISVTVNKVPEDNMPVGYTGLVCTRLEAALRVKDISAGQTVQLHAPIPVEITLKCDTLPEKILLPPWRSQHRLFAAFEVSSNPPVTELVEGGIVFKEITLRPLKVESGEIPPLDFPYFHPVEKAFKTARTAAFPIKVEKVESAETLSPLPLAALASPKEEPRAAVSHLDGLEENPEKLLAAAKSGFGLPLATYLGLLPWIALLLRGSLPALVRRARERRASGRFGLADSLRALSAAVGPSEMLLVLRGYVCRRFALGDPHLLRLKDAGLQKDALTMLERLESASYGKTAGAKELRSGEVAEIIRRLDKETE